MANNAGTQYKCRRCSFVGDVSYFLSNKRICKTCMSCRIKARKYDRNRGLKRKLWRQEYSQRQSTKQRRKSETKKYYEENKEAILDKNRAYHKQNKLTRARYLSEWRKNNKDKVKEYAHKRRMKKKKNNGGDLTSAQIKKLFNEHPYCEYCGATSNLALEHIIPISRGGPNSLANVTIACKSCNSSKYNKLLSEWRR